MEKEFQEFVKNNFGLEIRRKKRIIFRSKDAGIKGFLKFIKKYGRRFENLTVFDKKVGNAVALLSVYIKAKEVFAVIGSRTAQKTLKKFKIKFHFKKTIPRILNIKGNDICPLEKLSHLKTPEEFYELVK